MLQTFAHQCRSHAYVVIFDTLARGEVIVRVPKSTTSYPASCKCSLEFLFQGIPTVTRLIPTRNILLLEYPNARTCTFLRRALLSAQSFRRRSGHTKVFFILGGRIYPASWRITASPTSVGPQVPFSIGINRRHLL